MLYGFTRLWQRVKIHPRIPLTRHGVVLGVERGDGEVIGAESHEGVHDVGAGEGVDPVDGEILWWRAEDGPGLVVTD